MNGYTKSSEVYKANNRVKKVKIILSDGTSYIRDLQDGKMDFQYIEFPKNHIVERVKIVILEIYPGSKYHDTCISEIGVVEGRK